MVFDKQSGRSAILFIAFLALLSVLGFLPPAAAQEGETPAAEAPPVEPEAAPEPEAVGEAPYAYNVAGRRDPFKSLLERNTEGGAQRPEGLPGIQITEVDVLGVVAKSDGTFMAMIKGAGNESFTIHVGDRLFDGEVQEIFRDRVVFRQRINDPTLPRNYREVSVQLNPDEEGNR